MKSVTGYKVTGFKIFDSDWKCRGKQYSCPGVFEEEDEPSVCVTGMHFCEDLRDCFLYKSDTDERNHYAKVVALGSIDKIGNKCATNKLDIIEEIPFHEVLKMVNSGFSNIGFCNYGSKNVGDLNDGDYNVGSGNRGWRNVGWWNYGSCNAGDFNSGDHNSGSYNVGHFNTGSHNIGSYVTGDWNKCDRTIGCFNTKPFNDVSRVTIPFFNKPSDWSYYDWNTSKANIYLADMDTKMMEWKELETMSEFEKQHNPCYKYTRGYLDVHVRSDYAQTWWDRLAAFKKKAILSLPNFDAEIFKEITSIDVTRKKIACYSDD